jgi:hypothetical protein
MPMHSWSSPSGHWARRRKSWLRNDPAFHWWRRVLYVSVTWLGKTHVPDVAVTAPGITHARKRMSWYGLWKIRILGPLFYQCRVTGDNYLVMLTKETFRGIVSKQDGAPYHYRKQFFLRTTSDFHFRIFTCWGTLWKYVISNIFMNELSLYAVRATSKNVKTFSWTDGRFRAYTLPRMADTRILGIFCNLCH